MAEPMVALLMGSKSDLMKVTPAEETLAEMGVRVKTAVISAHRQPEKLLECIDAVPHSARSGRQTFSVKPKQHIGANCAHPHQPFGGFDLRFPPGGIAQFCMRKGKWQCFGSLRLSDGFEHPP